MNRHQKRKTIALARNTPLAGADPKVIAARYEVATRQLLARYVGKTATKAVHGEVLRELYGLTIEFTKELKKNQAMVDVLNKTRDNIARGLGQFFGVKPTQAVEGSSPQHAAFLEGDVEPVAVMPPSAEVGYLEMKGLDHAAPGGDTTAVVTIEDGTIRHVEMHDRHEGNP
jgi:hypothetical protein